MERILKGIIVALILVLVQTLYAQEKLEFKSLSDMNYARYGFGYTSDGKNIYVVDGGSSPLPLANNLECYDIAQNTWSIVSHNLVPRRYCNAEYIPSENKIFVFNGEKFTLSDCVLSYEVEVIDLNQKKIGTGIENPYPVKKAGSVVWNNKIYFFGGRSFNDWSNRFYEYDPAKNEWKRLPDMLEAKETSGKIVNGVLYILGGYDGSEVRSIDAYNFKTETWTRIGDLPNNVSAHATVADGENIWMIGSYRNLEYLATFNPGTKSISKFESNMTGRRHSGAEIIGNILYIFGGNQTEENRSALSSTEYASISSGKK